MNQQDYNDPSICSAGRSPVRVNMTYWWRRGFSPLKEEEEDIQQPLMTENGTKEEEVTTAHSWLREGGKQMGLAREDTHRTHMHMAGKEKGQKPLERTAEDEGVPEDDPAHGERAYAVQRVKGP